MKRFFFCWLMALGALIVLALPAAAQVQVNPLFTDNMVLHYQVMGISKE